MRISETLAIKPADFDAGACTMRVLHGKGDKARLVVLDGETVAILQVWLERRASLGIKGHSPIFCSLKGRPMAANKVREMLPRRAAKASITKRVHAHGLRHSGASDMVADGIPLLEIQAQLGHADAATTSKYLHQLNPVARIERLRQRKW